MPLITQADRMSRYYCPLHRHLVLAGRFARAGASEAAQRHIRTAAGIAKRTRSMK